MAINVKNKKLADRAERRESSRAIMMDDINLSSNAGHLADVENSLGSSLDSMTRPSNMVGRLEVEMQNRRRRREIIENEWLDSYRRYNSEYSPDVKSRFQNGRCKIWIGLTHMKVHSMHAAIMDTFDKEIWDLEPRPIADDVKINPTLMEMGVTVDDIREESRLRTENMKTEIGNQLDDSDFTESLDMATLECCITGTGVVKGPFTIKSTGSDWNVDFDANGAVITTEAEREGYKPVCSYVSVFNIFPDMEANNIQKGNGIFEEMYLTRSQMIDLAMQDGFSTASVLRLLRDFPRGNANLRPEYIELRRIAGDADPTYSTRYRVVIYHGEITGQELSNAGVKVGNKNLTLQTKACIWYCGQYVLKVKQHKGAIPYHIFQYVRRTGFGPFGKGIPYLTKHSQDMVNVAGRILIDNAAIASGPYIEANVELLQPGEDPTDLHGWKVFLSKHDGAQSKKAISVYNLPAYTDQFIKIINLFRQLMDEESFQPSLTGGMEGQNTNSTATGMSILNTNANRSMKKVIRNIDFGLIEPLIEAYFQWNMLYTSKENILSSSKPVAMGAATIMAREFQSQRLIQFGQMYQGHPDLKSTDLMRQTAESMDLKPDSIVVSEKEKTGQVAQDPAGNMTTGQPQRGDPEQGMPQGQPQMQG